MWNADTRARLNSGPFPRVDLATLDLDFQFFLETGIRSRRKKKKLFKKEDRRIIFIECLMALL